MADGGVAAAAGSVRSASAPTALRVQPGEVTSQGKSNPNFIRKARAAMVSVVVYVHTLSQLAAAGHRVRRRH